jgi:hypothetical protein
MKTIPSLVKRGIRVSSYFFKILVDCFMEIEEVCKVKNEIFNTNSTAYIFKLCV